MTAEYKKMMQALQAKQYAPVYLIDGEEAFYLDIITNYFEEQILPPHERDFNLMVLYGKDVEWADVVNSCRRFPMFAERQVVILKDAAQMRGFNELAGYLENPSPTTVLLIEHRFKKADGRSKVVKYAKEKGFHFTSDKIKDDHVPGWIQGYGHEIKFEIGERESQILATYLGNDLQKIVNEIEKVRINVPDEPRLTADLIQKYIGISREYNVFEFPEALTNGDKDKLYRMLSYFVANPKSAPMVLIIGSFYNHFNRIYQAHFLHGKPEKEQAAALGTYPSRVREIMSTAARWPLPKVEESLMILGNYSTKTVGIDNTAGDTELLKELVGRLESI
ncbi:MAG: DNA polymerase III subunit delta [Bacteroidetes bacterium 43-93]|nr:DNA polymerase III subunit delta [Bacteroidota bacterium]OJW98139.1 MAG: DNA polymerase III subunit delta [Bacteroidetes bacterium 43-93]